MRTDLDVQPGASGPHRGAPDPAGEIARLRRQVERERTARRESERIGESATSQLYATVRRLQRVEDELRVEAEIAECSHELGRMLRGQLDPDELLQCAVAELGPVLDLDRCLIRVQPDDAPDVLAQWTSPDSERIPEDAAPPPALAALLEARGALDDSLWIPDLEGDERLDDEGASARALGVRAFGAVPLRLGERTAGWLTLHRRSASSWTLQDCGIAAVFAQDLLSALLQALAHRREQDTVARLREVDGLKTQMVSTVSHELRTPLSSIRGYLEIWEDGHLGRAPASMLASMDVVRRNCLRLEALVENLLSLCRADAGQVDPAMPVDLPALVAEAERTLSPTLVGRRLNLDIGPCAPVPGLTGRPADLERALLNLLHNAVKFTPDGGHVSLTVHPFGDVVEVVVADTGMGIPEPEHEHLFERFFRASNALRSEVQGTGLGLALVHTVVAQHQGSVHLDSAAGAGTTVTVRLPVGRVD